MPRCICIGTAPAWTGAFKRSFRVQSMASNSRIMRVYVLHRNLHAFSPSRILQLAKAKWANKAIADVHQNRGELSLKGLVAPSFSRLSANAPRIQRLFCANNTELDCPARLLDRTVGLSWESRSHSLACTAAWFSFLFLLSHFSKSASLLFMYFLPYPAYNTQDGTEKNNKARRKTKWRCRKGKDSESIFLLRKGEWRKRVGIRLRHASGIFLVFCFLERQETKRTWANEELE